MRLFDRFDKVFCINLDIREDRLDNFNKEVEKFNLGEYERISAIDGRNLIRNGNLSLGALGLIRTVKKILEISIINNYEKIAIIEDDCYFTDEMMKIDDYFEVLPSDWEMLYLGGNHVAHLGHPTVINEKVVKLQNTYTSHFVGLKSNLFEEIIEWLEKEVEPIDVTYTILQKKYNAYSFYPGIAKQLKGFSNINQENIDYDWLIS